MGNNKDSSLENLHEEQPAKSYSSTGQKTKKKRPLSSTGRMKNNFMKSNKKYEDEESEDEEMQLLNQLQQLNCLDQTQLSSSQLNQFQELLKIKEDL